MKRDKQKTMQRLLSAVGRIIRKRGCLAVGINTVAEEAKVDKVLIYRYFGSLENLLKAYVSQADYYRAASGEIAPLLDLSTGKKVRKEGARVILEQLRRLRAFPELQEIYLWELTSNNPVAQSLAAQREREGTALLSLFSKHIDFSKADIPALSSVILAGGIYLVLRGKRSGVFNGIDLETSEGWERIEQAIDTLLTATTRGATRPARKRVDTPVRQAKQRRMTVQQ
jgi:AcrR family transcriptional regulator